MGERRRCGRRYPERSAARIEQRIDDLDSRRVPAADRLSPETIASESTLINP
jgi:hypothetical protein